jgi:hypothetical protein
MGEQILADLSLSRPIYVNVRTHLRQQLQGRTGHEIRL